MKLGAKRAISYPEGNESTPFFFVRSSVYSLIMIVIVRRVRFDNKRSAQFNPKRTNKVELGAKMGHYGSQGCEKTDFLDENLCSYTHQY